MICPCLFQNCLSVRVLNFLLLFLLFFLICSVTFPRVEGLCMERALKLLCYICRAWNPLWHYCVIFSVCGGPVSGTRSGVIVLYFSLVECALALLCYIIRAWNALWYFVLNLFRVVIYLPCDFPVFISKLS